MYGLQAPRDCREVKMQEHGLNIQGICTSACIYVDVCISRSTWSRELLLPSIYICTLVFVLVCSPLKLAFGVLAR
jgi:hypothetical protein